MYYGDYGHGGFGWGGFLAMAAMMIVFWGGIAWVVVTMIRQGGSRPEARTPDRPEAIRLLDERFARGEIDEEEYQRRRLVLGGGS